MQMLRLDHVNVRTANVDAMAEFYETILGLKRGARPDFPFPGAWMYIGDEPIIHLVGVAKECATVEPKLEHFAIKASGMGGLIAKLKDAGIPHTIDPVPGFPIVQINLHDVDGNHIHIDFHNEEIPAEA